MEGNNLETYGYLPTQTSLASWSYPANTVDPRMLSTGFVPSQNMDTEFQAFEANTPNGIAPPNVHAQNNPLSGDGNLSQAKKRRGRPPGSKNKVKVDVKLNGPEQPKRQGRAVASKRKAKSSPQSAPSVQFDGLNLPEGSIPGNQDIVLDPALIQNTRFEGEGLIY